MRYGVSTGWALITNGIFDAGTVDLRPTAFRYLRTVERPTPAKLATYESGTAPSCLSNSGLFEKKSLSLSYLGIPFFFLRAEIADELTLNLAAISTSLAVPSKLMASSGTGTISSEALEALSPMDSRYLATRLLLTPDRSAKYLSGKTPSCSIRSGRCTNKSRSGSKRGIPNDLRLLMTAAPDTPSFPAMEVSVSLPSRPRFSFDHSARVYFFRGIALFCSSSIGITRNTLWANALQPNCHAAPLPV